MTEHDSDKGEDRFHRRGFFREGLRHFLKPLADAIEERTRNLPDWGFDDDEPDYSEGQYGHTLPYGSESDPNRTLLRPPGALPENEFLARCAASGACVSACPVSAIRLADDSDPARSGKPSIDPDIQACVMCDDLSCTKSCPSGALQPVTAEHVHMGLAEVHLELCVRRQGEDCQICVDKCPVGPLAIGIPELGGDVEVKVDGCTGCGVCQMYCPTDPRAIVVRPRED